VLQDFGSLGNRQETGKRAGLPETGGPLIGAPQYQDDFWQRPLEQGLPLDQYGAYTGGTGL
jgi:hypothetical protein